MTVLLKYFKSQNNIVIGYIINFRGFILIQNSLFKKMAF